MGKEEETLFERLGARVRQLIEHNRQLSQQVDTLRQALRQSEAREAELESRCLDLSSRYDNLKIAKSLELSEGDSRAAHRRFTNLVRQVDECIALLKA